MFCPHTNSKCFVSATESAVLNGLIHFFFAVFAVFAVYTVFTVAVRLRWAFLIDVAVALKCFGVATSYLVVIG